MPIIEPEHLAVVVPPSNLEVRRAKHVHSQFGQELRRSFEVRVYQKAVLMWVAKNGLVNGVAAFLFPVRDFEAKSRTRYTVDLTNEIPTLVMKETLAVSDQELQVADLR
jgi:hypothetical protein